MPLLILSISWICGIFLGTLLNLPLWTIAFSILPLLMLPFLKHYYKKIILAAFAMVLFLGGTIYSGYSLNNIPQDNISSFNNTGTIVIKGMIAEEPSVGDRTASFHLNAEQIISGDDKSPVSGKVLVRTSRYPEYHFGDLITASGVLKTPVKYDDFDYQNYLAIRDIYSVMDYPDIEITARNQGNNVPAFIYSVRNSMAQSIDRALPEPQSGLAKGIFLGIPGSIPQSIRAEFAGTGTSHVLAISGLHLTIIIGLLVMAGSLIFGRRYNIHIWLAFIVVWIYAVFTGLDMPIIRSAIMGSVFLLAIFLGRQRNALPALTLAAAIMLGFQPKIIGDISFQLSYLSMCGLILVFPYFQKLSLLQKPDEEDRSIINRISRVILTGLFVILSALIGIAPIIAYNFGVLPVLAIPATIFILPALPLIIITSALVAIIGLVIPFLAMIIGWLDWLFISYMLLIVRIFDALPLASIDIKITEPWQVWCYYIILLIILLIAGNFRRFTGLMKAAISRIKTSYARVYKSVSGTPVKWALPVLIVIAALVWATVITLPDDKLHVSILDIGQGDSILIQTPSHQNILIDGGPGAQQLKMELGEKLPFWNRKIDLMIITQPHSDHITGLIDIINDYEVGSIVRTDCIADSEVYRQLLDAVETKQIPEYIVYSGQVIDLGDDLEMEVLHPPQVPYQCSGENRDCNCLVIRLLYRNVSFLFTADIPEEVELYLLSKQFNVNSTVLKVAHHGSRTSSNPSFLKSVDMYSAVISAGYDNRYGHPSLDTISRLARTVNEENIYITSRDGTIEYITDGDSLWVKTDD
jgi:competence protein ComEC